MEIKVGVQNAQRELSIDVDEPAQDIEKRVADVVAGGGVLTLADAKGRKLVVPVDRLAYVEITATATGTVGFRS